MTAFPDNLIDGYHAFKQERFADERNRYRELAEKGQSPSTLVISCCDSRVAPETIFNVSPGDIFVVRNVANLAPPYEPEGHDHTTSAALEFAVQGLKIRQIVVLGHAQCGGVKAALNPGGEPLSPDDFIGKWIKLLGPPAEEVSSNKGLTDAERQTALERLSIRYSIDRLKAFPMISLLAGEGRIGLHGAWFDIADGELWLMDPETGDFSPA